MLGTTLWKHLRPIKEEGATATAALGPIPSLLVPGPCTDIASWQLYLRSLAINAPSLAYLSEHVDSSAAVDLRMYPDKRMDLFLSTRVVSIEHRKERRGRQLEYLLVNIKTRWKEKGNLRIKENVGFRLERLGDPLPSQPGPDATATRNKHLPRKNKRRDMSDRIVVENLNIKKRRRDFILCGLTFDEHNAPSIVDLCAACSAVSMRFPLSTPLFAQNFFFAATVYFILERSYGGQHHILNISRRGKWRGFRSRASMVDVGLTNDLDLVQHPSDPSVSFAGDVWARSVPLPAEAPPPEPLASTLQGLSQEGIKKLTTLLEDFQSQRMSILSAMRTQSRTGFASKPPSCSSSISNRSSPNPGSLVQMQLVPHSNNRPMIAPMPNPLAGLGSPAPSKTTQAKWKMPAPSILGQSMPGKGIPTFDDPFATATHTPRMGSIMSPRGPPTGG